MFSSASAFIGSFKNTINESIATIVTSEDTHSESNTSSVVNVTFEVIDAEGCDLTVSTKNTIGATKVVSVTTTNKTKFVTDTMEKLKQDLSKTVNQSQEGIGLGIQSDSTTEISWGLVKNRVEQSIETFKSNNFVDNTTGVTGITFRLDKCRDTTVLVDTDQSVTFFASHMSESIVDLFTKNSTIIDEMKTIGIDTTQAQEGLSIGGIIGMVVLLGAAAFAVKTGGFKALIGGGKPSKMAGYVWLGAGLICIILAIIGFVSGALIWPIILMVGGIGATAYGGVQVYRLWSAPQQSTSPITTEAQARAWQGVQAPAPQANPAQFT